MGKTYDLTATIPAQIATGDILNCPYSGAAVNITLPKGTYKLECWGAQGGSYNTSYLGGYGGYSYGTISFAEDTTVYLYAGGQGGITNSTTHYTAGFNGGGKGVYREYDEDSTVSTAGGGGTDIRIGSDSLYARVIVAGGGGGSCNHGGSVATSCYGGGLNGGSGQSTGGGTQTAGGYPTDSNKSGSFGQGRDSTGGTNYNYGCGGGGGGWYGGGANYYSDGSTYYNYCGGGSGYVYTESTASNYPSGCLLNSAYYLSDAETIGGNQVFAEPSGVSGTGHSGNGYVRITVIKTAASGLFVKVDGAWRSVHGIAIKAI